jgi:hypothetical protein
MLAKMFEDYAEERGFGLRILETEFGFATYYLDKDHCYIEDIYVVPDKRKNHVASFMADEISKIAKNNAPPGAKVGHLHPRRTGKVK